MHDVIVHITNSQITNRKALENFFNEIKRKDGKYLLTSKRANKRGIQFNRFYWGVIVAMIRDRMIELGNDVTSEDVHNFLKDRFNSKDLFNKEGTVIGTVGATTADMNNEDFDKYCEKCRQFGADPLDIYIPLPQEQLIMMI